MAKLLTEFIGTFFLVITVALTAGHTDFAPIAIGFSLACMVFAGGHISGAHYNPAVTLGLLVRGKIEVGEALGYIAVQVVAGFVAALTAQMMAPEAALGHPAPGEGVAVFAAVLAEIVFTFALVYVVLHVAVSEDNAGNSFYGLAIGCTVMFSAFAAGGISGGAFNPAVGTGPCVLASDAGNIWIYWVGPMAGAVLAAVVYGIQDSSSGEEA